MAPALQSPPGMNRLLLSSASAALLLAACGESHDDARFSTADSAHLDRALDVIEAGDAGQLLLIGVFTSGENRTGCPTITSAGPVTTITTDCVNDAGNLVRGRIVVTNMPSAIDENPAYDPLKPSSVEAFDLSVTEDDQVQRLDGKVTIGVRDADYIGTLEARVDATVDGLTAHTDVTYGCDETDLCTFGDDSWFDVDGIGAATLSGTFRFDDPRYGSIVATGIETLVLDVAASGDGCRAVTIDGQSRSTCEPPAARLTPAASSADLAGPTTLARRFARAPEVQLFGEALLDHVGH